MNEMEFANLLKSVREAGQILRGEKQAAREFVVEVPPAEAQAQTSYALCVQPDNPALLALRKVYAAKYSQGGLVRVIDEAGESSIYPQEFFLPLALPKEVEQVLEKVVA